MQSSPRSQEAATEAGTPEAALAVCYTRFPRRRSSGYFLGMLELIVVLLFALILIQLFAVGGTLRVIVTDVRAIRQRLDGSAEEETELA